MNARKRKRHLYRFPGRRVWVRGFVRQMERYPMGVSDDRVDAFAYAARYWKMP